MALLFFKSDYSYICFLNYLNIDIHFYKANTQLFLENVKQTLFFSVFHSSFPLNRVVCVFNILN